ncbi:hypothetical protein AB5I41_29245 [Sphingomonas sp. MMS24-JH45]
MLTGLILLTTLAIDVGADRALFLRRRRAGGARRDGGAAGAARGTGEGDSAPMPTDRLARIGGPGQGFSATAAAAFQIVQASTGSELTALQFEPNGSLRLTLSTASEAEANAIKSRLERAGFTVTASVFQSSGGRLTGELTVAP